MIDSLTVDGSYGKVKIWRYIMKVVRNFPFLTPTCHREDKTSFQIADFVIAIELKEYIDK